MTTTPETGLRARPSLEERAAAWIDAEQTTVNDPYPLWAELRAACPILQEPGHGVWLITRYDDCRTIARDNTNWSSVLAAKGTLRGEDVPSVHALRAHVDAVCRGRRPPDRTADLIDAVLTDQADRLQHSDPPIYTEYRAMVNRWFTPARVAELEPRVRAVARSLAELLPRQPARAEFLIAFAGPLPGTIIADLLDVPQGFRSEFVEWDKEVHGNTPLFEGSAAHAGVQQQRSRRIRAWLRDAVQTRRTEPGTDLISELASSTTSDGAPVEDRHAVAIAHTFHVGGQETTSKLLTSAMRVLASDGPLQTELRAHPQRIPEFIEEVLRIQSPTQGLFRVARHATIVGGTEFPAGALVQLLWGSANRDESVFATPDDIVLGGEDRRSHLAFGHGIHLCPGNHLARLEGRIAFEEVLAATEWIQLAPSNTFDYMTSHIMRGLRRLDLEIA